MSTQAERLTNHLIVNTLTIEEIAAFLSTDKGNAKQVISTMRRRILPDLGAWCPRPTYENGYVYTVLDVDPTGDSLELQVNGARAMQKDNRRRLITMLETAKPYAKILDRRTKEGRAADVYVKAATAALAALELIDI